jgi:hypothetical protein
MLQSVLLTVMLCNHADTCQTAVLRVGLFDERKLD